MTALQCAMAVLIVIDGGLWHGDFRSGFTEMCWGHKYHQSLEIKAHYQLHRR